MLLSVAIVSLQVLQTLFAHAYTPTSPTYHMPTHPHPLHITCLHTHIPYISHAYNTHTPYISHAYNTHPLHITCLHTHIPYISHAYTPTSLTYHMPTHPHPLHITRPYRFLRSLQWTHPCDPPSPHHSLQDGLHRQSHLSPPTSVQ